MISKGAVKTLFDLYMGDNVILYLKNMNVVVGNDETGQMEISAMISGIIMEIDQDFIHIGDGEMITKSIYHENVGLIESMLVDESLISLDLPENDLEIN